MHPIRPALFLLPVFALVSILSSCGPKTGPSGKATDGINPGVADAPVIAPGRIKAVRFIDPVSPTLVDGAITARGARNETIHYAIQINSLPDPRRPAFLKLNPLVVAPNSAAPAKETETPLPVSNCVVYQILPMPVETNHAGFLRYTGLAATRHRPPRALIPLPLALDGTLNLANLRDPEKPGDLAAHPSGEKASAMLWVDVQIPATLAAGRYATVLQIVQDNQITASANVQVQIDDFVISDERHLLMVGAIEWDNLTRLWPERFNGLRARLMSRNDPRYADAIKTLDQLVALAQAHRCQPIVPALQPTVAWPAAKPPQIDWGDFDSVVAPWLKGDVFADQVPLGYWPMPIAERLDLHARSERSLYWSDAAAHFAANDWIKRSSIEVQRHGQGRPDLEESIDLSVEAAQLLATHPNLRVTVPLEEGQVHLATPQEIKRIQPITLDRLLYAGAGLVSVPPIQRLPDPNPAIRWLRTDLPGLIPYVGAGADERETRAWAWLARVRDARLIRWAGVLPRQTEPSTPAQPDDLVWFYPGEWFGLDHPVPTVQLKWLRRAEQDYEYLFIAGQRKQGDRAVELARILTKPVELQGVQSPDPIYGLMSATADPEAWDQALGLLAQSIELAQPGQVQVNRDNDVLLHAQIVTWSARQQRPLVLGRELTFAPTLLNQQKPRQIELILGADVYNIAKQRPDPNRMEWGTTPPAWVPASKPVLMPGMAPFTVNRVRMQATIDLESITPGRHEPMRLNFIDGDSGITFPLEMMVPVSCSDRIDPRQPPPKVDGNLRSHDNEWHQEDSLHEGPLVVMLNRPTFQKQALEMTQHNASIYSAWTPVAFYVAFKVEGADNPIANAQRNFVEYEFRRAWGEDICEVLVQPIYDDNTTGPLFHAAVKPSGASEMERRLNPRGYADPWQPFNGGGIRYGVNMAGSVWRGEMEIPWVALNAPNDNRRPAFLRFNFVQHRGLSGQTSSWAGPIDFSRDDGFMGLLEIRSPKAFNGPPPRIPAPPRASATP